MRKQLSLILLAAFLLATPLMARHKHRRGCGHYYEPNRGWLSIEVHGRRGGFSYRQAPRNNYYRDGYYDGRRNQRYCKRKCRRRHRHFYQPSRHRHHRRCPPPRRRGRW